MAPPIDLEALLRREDASVEWKRNVADIEDVVRTLSAFANNFTGLSEGGWVVCGVEEERDEHGFVRPRTRGLDASRFQEIKGKVLSWCRERVSPPLVPTVEEVILPDEPSRRILVFFVAASPYLHHFRSRDGASTCWTRFDSETVEARGELLRQLRQRKQDAPPVLERPCLDANLTDLDLLATEEFLTAAGLPRPAAEYLTPGARLEASASPLVVSQPASPGETRDTPTYLALLLFSREPTRFLPGAYAVFSVYDGVSRTESHSERFLASAPLPKLIRNLLEKLQLYTGLSIDKSVSARESRQNRPRYSEKALQEAIVNAFAHRDYESPEPVRITVFADRIEIASPGGMIPGMDPERLRQANSLPRWRNSALASFLLRMGLAQNEGQGLPTILQETLAVAERRPEIRPGQDSFEVVIPAYQPALSPIPRDDERPGEDLNALILIAIGAESIRPAVEHSLPSLDLHGSEILVDLVVSDYVSPDTAHWEAEARRIRNEIRLWIENPRYSRFHLFYRGPVVLAPLLGALIAPAKPLVVYHYQNGRYGPAYTLDRRFLISKT
jgi:ATP-dependent DNA helicase RecG